MKKLNFIILGIFLAAIVSITGCATGSDVKPNNIAHNEKVTVFKSPSCGCCGGYVAELRENGFDVEVVETTDLASIKSKYNIPQNMQSCHTTVIGDYFIEGHVPIEAVNKMLEENPDIDGISLPRMPSGSPGMPGQKRGTWTIYSLSDGQSAEFIKI